jgi:hypothetical protein
MRRRIFFDRSGERLASFNSHTPGHTQAGGSEPGGPGWRLPFVGVPIQAPGRRAAAAGAHMIPQVAWGVLNEQTLP